MTTYIFNQQAFIDRLEQEMMNRGVTSHQVADKAGVSRPQISRMLGGYLNPSADTLVKYLMWLGDTDIGPYITTKPDQAPRDE